MFGTGSRGKRRSFVGEAAEKLLEKNTEIKALDALYQGRMRFPKSGRKRAAAPANKRFQKTAWGSSEDEGGLWTIEDLAGSPDVEAYYAEEVTRVFASDSRKADVAAHFRAYVRKMNQQVKAEVLEAVKNARATQEGGADPGTEPPGGSQPRGVSAGRRAASSAVVSWRTASVVTDARGRSLSIPRSVSFQGTSPEATRCVTPQRESSGCTLKPPPTVSSSSTTLPSLSEATEVYEYDDVVEHYKVRVRRTLEVYRPDLLPLLPVLSEDYHRFLDQVLRVLVECHGAEPGRLPPVALDYPRRLEAYWRQVQPEVPVDHKMIEEFVARHEDCIEREILELMVHYGQREAVVPEEAFPAGEAPELTLEAVFAARVSQYLLSLGGRKAAISNDPTYIALLGRFFSYNADLCLLRLSAML